MHEYVVEIKTWNSGGNIMLDIVTLNNGNVIVISDDAVSLWNSENEFFEDDGEQKTEILYRDYEENC